MSVVKMVVFNNGLQLVSELVDADKSTGKLLLKKPVSLVLIPRGEAEVSQGKVGMAFTPFMQYTEEWELGIPVSISDVLTVLTPTKDLVSNYTMNFGSGLILPGGLLK